MKRADYIKQQATILKRLCDQRDKKRGCDLMQLSPKQAQKRSADLNFLGMDIERTKERLAFGLGLLLPEDARKEYRPSSFHRYDGIGKELEKTKFDD